ncbi:MAG: DJ-1/PfpI family protein [Spirochaetes bacterium]|nr:DJ-1/PfpI family protein [Spirochaetota bacterium]
MAGKHAVFIVAQKNFRDEEYFEPKKILEAAGIAVSTASSYLTPATGKLGGTAEIDLLFTEIDASKFDIVIFVGGSGVVAYWDDWRAQSVAKLFLENNKPVAAICSAPVILAKAGLLKGKRATSFNGDSDKMRECGAVYSDKEVEIDGLIITANGPEAAKAFGRTIVEFLSAR